MSPESKKFCCCKIMVFQFCYCFFFFFLCFVEAVEWDEGRCMDVLMCVWNLLGLLDLACEVSEYLSVIVLN